MHTLRGSPLQQHDGMMASCSITHAAPSRTPCPPVCEQVRLVRLALHAQVVGELALEALGALAVAEVLAHNGLGVHACRRKEKTGGLTRWCASADARKQQPQAPQQQPGRTGGRMSNGGSAAADDMACNCKDGCFGCLSLAPAATLVPCQAQASAACDSNQRSPAGTLGCLMVMANRSASSLARSSSALFLSCKGARAGRQRVRAGLACTRRGRRGWNGRRRCCSLRTALPQLAVRRLQLRPKTCHLLRPHTQTASAHPIHQCCMLGSAFTTPA